MQQDLFGEPARDLEQSQLFTPSWLARRMVEWVPKRARVLEPSCGSGNLVDALLRAGHCAGLIRALDVDHRWVDFAARRLPSVQVFLDNFLSESAAELCRDFRPDVVLMNPPFEENMHLQFVVRALELAPVVVGVFPVTFEYTQERDRSLWSRLGSVTRRALLPERVKYSSDGGQFESCVLRIARREDVRRYGEERQVLEETWLRDESPLLTSLSDVP